MHQLPARARRRLIIAAAIAAILALSAGALHTPPVRSAVLSWTVERLRAATGVRAVIGQLDYNLFTLTFSARQITLVAEGSDIPFFSADALLADLPWAAVRGRLAAQSLEVHRPRVTIVRLADGTYNLPPGSDTTAEPLSGPIEIDRFVIDGLALRYDDRLEGVLVDARNIDIDLQRPLGGVLRGRLSTSEHVSIRIAEHQTQLSRLDGTLAFDGRALDVEALTLEALEGLMRIDGRMNLLPRLELRGLRYSGRLDVARVTPWLDIDAAVIGRVAISGTAAGPIDQITLTADVAGDDLQWSSLRNISLRTHAVLSGPAVALDALRVTLAGGEIVGDARLPLEEGGSGHARLSWRNMRAGPVIAALVSSTSIRLASLADGAATLDWTGSKPLAGRATITNALRTTASSRGELPVSGRATLNLDAGLWRASHDHRIGAAAALSGDAGGRVSPDAPASSTLNGRADLQIDDLSSALLLARRAGLVEGASALSELGGVVSITANLAGTVGAPRATGAIDATSLRYRETGPGSATARYSVDTRRILIDPLRLVVGMNTIDGRAAIDTSVRTIRAELNGDLPNLADLTADAPARWRPAGSASVEARITGTLDRPVVAAELASGGLQIADQAVQRLRSTLRLANRVVTVDSLELLQDGGQLKATGTYALSTGRFRGEVAGENLTFTASHALNVPLDARFDLELSGTGTAAAPAASGFVQFSRLSWQGYELGSVRMDVRTEGRTLEVNGRAPELTATAVARIALDAPRSFSADVSLVDATLTKLARPSGPAGGDTPEDKAFADRVALGGSVSLRAHATGGLDDIVEATADLDLRLTGATVNGMPVQLARPARLRYSSEAIVADDLELRVGSTTLAAKGRLATGTPDSNVLRISVKGMLADLAPLVRVVPDLEGSETAGTIDLQARVTGAPKSPEIDADFAVTSGSFTSGTLPPVTDISLRGSYQKGLLDLRELRALWQGASVSGTGQIPATLLGDNLPQWYAETLPALREPARAIVRISSITPAALSPFVDAESLADVTGRIDAVAAFTATSLDAGDIQAEVTLERAEMTLARVPLNQSRPTRLRLAGGRLQVVDWTWAGAGNRINLSGGALLTGKSPELDLALEGTLDLRMFSAFSRDVATTGRAALDVRVTGLADQPLVDGRMSIENGGLVMRTPRIAVTDLEGTVAFRRDELQLVNITANANGGTLRVSGSVHYPKLEITGGVVAVAGRGLAFEMPEHLRSEVDADLELDLSAASPTLTGIVTVLRGSYREPVSLAAQLLSGVETRSAVPQSARTAGFADRIALAIDIYTAEDLIVDNNYARFDMGANLEIVGTIGEPVPTGRLTIGEGGDVFLGGRTYEVVRGTVDFMSRTRVEPNIDLVLETRVQRNDITLEVTGTPDTIKVSLRSPGMSQADVVSLLLTGQRADSSAIAETEIARGQLLMLLSGELLGFAGRAVGLDTLQIGRGLGAAASDFDLLATDTDPSARLTISKNLSRDVELVFSQSLRETGDVTWIALYRPFGNIEVRGATQDDGSRSYEFRHELNFGGGAATDASLAQRGRRADERVAAVRITGAPGFEEAEIRKRLHLSEGDRFDFYRWQRDRDRLQRFYRDRGFLEARISARRPPSDTTASGSGGITLAYDIDRGPETKLTIEGHALPGSLVEHMKDAWVWAVFDAFLLEDLASLAREQLTADGYVRANVEASVVSEPDQPIKEIAIRIEPGARYTDRQITFSGQEALSAETLDALVHAQGVDATMWHEPARLKAAIEQHYQARGYLDAVVDVQAAIFREPSAELPVRISEGRPFTIDGFVIKGAMVRSVDDIRRAFAVAAGAPYLPAALEPARRAVELDYLRDGFNDVRATITTLVDEEHGQVDLVLDIDEGRQQVLADVTVKGAAITRRGVIDRALDIEVGQPADLSEFYRAEKRLYDTGAFRVADIALVPFEKDAGGAVERVRAEVTLQEVPPYRFRYGFRANDTITPTETDREVRPALVVDLLRRNLFGSGIAVGAAGQLEADRRLIRGIVSLPRFFGLPMATNFFVTSSREDFTPEGATPFVEDQTGFTAEQRFALTPRMAVTYGYNYSRTHVFEPEPLPGIPPLELQAKVARLTGTYAWDRRNDPFSPQSGWFHSSGFEIGAKALRSDLRFVKYLAQQYYYKNTRGGLVLASAVRLGLGAGFDQDLIPSEKFFVGGGTSVRGFAEDGVGERDFFGDPRGGNSMVILNQEARFPIYGWAGGVAFIDAGNVFPKASVFSLRPLEAGAGIGLRLYSPFALVRVDFGVPLTNRQREPSGRWYVGIGHAF